MNTSIIFNEHNCKENNGNRAMYGVRFSLANGVIVSIEPDSRQDIRSYWLHDGVPKTVDFPASYNCNYITSKFVRSCTRNTLFCPVSTEDLPKLLEKCANYKPS